MSDPSRYKRQNMYSELPKRQDESTEALQTVGMRIRKAVADGYQVPPPEPVTTPFGPRRTALPDHLQEPPSLLYGGSTASSLSEWQNDVNLTNKRKFEDYDDSKDFQGPDSDFLTKNRDLQGFQQVYGTLRFDEDF
ncbi:hypothetical protein LJB42_002878 [Komagataella kurtzmanii]|nr:hypothetical protein LJB42_002878 [Komagataella kurtzmanii]